MGREGGVSFVWGKSFLGLEDVLEIMIVDCFWQFSVVGSYMLSAQKKRLVHIPLGRDMNLEVKE